METVQIKKYPLDLTVIIVNYNTAGLLQNCLKSIYLSDFPKSRYEVIVVDNGSIDDSGVMVKNNFPKTTLIENKQNLGYAKANNIGIRQASGRYILLLNSDTKLSPNVFTNMFKFNEQRNLIGASTCKLILENGMLDPACHRGFPTPGNSLGYFLGLEKIFPHHKVFGGYHLTYLNLKHPHEIDCPSGAFFWVPRSVIDQVGMLDEDYFMYAEDIDWAYRIKKAGYKIWFNPEVFVFHLKKQSGRSNQNKDLKIKTEILFHQNNKLFYQKHYEQIYPKFISFFIYLIYNIRIYLLSNWNI